MLDEGSFGHLVLSQWVPGILTVSAGGMLATIVLPRLQDRFQRSVKLRDKKVEIAEGVVTAFNRYVVSWRRLIQISRLESVKSLSKSEQARKENFVEERNQRRDELMDKLRLCRLYFCDSVCGELERFMEWDEKQSAKGLEDLPDISEWRIRERHLIGMIKDEID